MSSSGLSYTKRRGVRVGGVYRDLPSDAAKLRKNYLPVFINCPFWNNIRRF